MFPFLIPMSSLFDCFFSTVKCSLPSPTQRFTHPSQSTQPHPLLAPRSYILLGYVIFFSFRPQYFVSLFYCFVIFPVPTQKIRGATRIMDLSWYISISYSDGVPACVFSYFRLQSQRLMLFPRTPTSHLLYHFLHF